MYELRTALFARLLDKLPDCDTCGGKGCDQPFGLTDKGFTTYHPDRDPTTVVAWPGCPRLYEVVREIGTKPVLMDECCRWAVERGVHRNPRITAGASLMLREYTRFREWPKSLAEARDYEEHKAKRGSKWG